MKSTSRKKTSLRRALPAGDILFALILISVFLVTVIPFLHLVSTSLSTAIGMKPGLRILPNNFTLDSYREVLKATDTVAGVKNSVLRVLLGVPLTVIVNALAAYATSKDDMVGGKTLRIFFVITMYLNVGIIPMYMTMRDYHLVGTFWVYLMNFATPFYMILMRNYMQGVPSSLEDAALLDGATYWQYFWRILVPLSKPILATVCLFTFINHWNVYTDCLFYNATKPENFTLQYVLYNQLSNVTSNLADKASSLAVGTTNPTTLRCALTCITSLPIILLYPVVQKYLVSGITVGAVKE